MDHAEAIRQKATERYLLDELEPEVRDEFEEHLFDCQDCALDVRAAASFIERSKVLLAEKDPMIIPVRTPARAAAKPSWMAWLRPAFAAPVFAALVAVIAFLVVTNHNLEQAANTARVLPSLMVNVSSRGGIDTLPQVSVPKGKPFLLYMRIPINSGSPSYKAHLSSPSDKLQWTVPISAMPGQDTYLIQIPAAGLESGQYTLEVQSISATGVSNKVGYVTPFQVQIEK